MNKLSIFNRMENYKCTSCPMRAKYEKNPKSFLGKFWRWHINFCPGWSILVFMMGLGIAIRLVPDIPTPFIAFFYSGLGPMLMLSAIRFWQRM